MGQRAAADEHEPKAETERGREQPRAKTAEPGGEQDGGDEDEEGAAVPKPWVQTPGQHEQDADGALPQPNNGCARSWGRGGL